MEVEAATARRSRRTPTAATPTILLAHHLVEAVVVGGGCFGSSGGGGYGSSSGGGYGGGAPSYGKQVSFKAEEMMQKTRTAPVIANDGKGTDECHCP